MKAERTSRELQRLVQNQSTLAMNIASLEAAIIKGNGLSVTEFLDINVLERQDGKRYATKIITTRRVVLIPVP